LAWNIPGHMLSGAIAYQVFRQENPQSIEKVKALLEKHPWYANQWQTNKWGHSGFLIVASYVGSFLAALSPSPTVAGRHFV
jgi:hypothetical protein